MRLRHLAYLALLPIVAASCSERAAPAGASAEPPSQASAPSPSGAVSGSSGAALAPPPPAGPRLAVLHAFPADTTLSRLARGLLACTDSCSTGTKDAPSESETFLVDRTGSKKAPLFPEAAWRASYGRIESIFSERRRVSFSGSYPEELWAHLDAPFDRGGYGYVTPLKAGASGWEQLNPETTPKRVGCYLESGTRALVRDDGRCDDSGLAATARRLLPALARAEVDPERLVVLPGEGSVLLLPGGYARLVGERWERRPAPWKAQPDAAVGLEDGRLVVASPEGIHVVTQEDEVLPVSFAASAAPDATALEGATSIALEVVGGEVWARLTHDGQLKLAAPAADAPWRRYLPKPAERPDPDARPEHALPQPVNLTEACTTPFVLLASNDQPSYVFSTSTAAFYGKKELQDPAFIQFTRDGSTYFGVQTKTHDQAKQAVEIAKAAKLRPQLTCLDALGHIPDVVDPPKGVRVYFVNLAHSATLWP